MNDAATRYGAHLVTPPQVSNRRCVLVLTRTKDYTLIEAAESRTVKVRMRTVNAINAELRKQQDV